MEVLTKLNLWCITLHSGAVIEVWASSYSTVNGFHVLETLVVADADELTGMVITGATPTDDGRVLVAIARLPASEVISVAGG
jgi:hypothetical protein